MGKLQVIVGGDFGSEGKGAVAGFLAAREQQLLAIRVAGPNAGHTVWQNGEGPVAGREFKLQQIPVAAVTNPRANLAIAAGSEIDMAILEREIAETGCRDRLLIDPSATLIEPHHSMAEHGGVGQEHGAAGITRSIGSTGKGVGAARADRIWRVARIFRDREGGYHKADVAGVAVECLRQGWTVQIEGTQGFGLGLHAGFYPYCTSSDCRAIDFLAMAGLSPWSRWVETLEIWIVFRTYPIRVAGNSGPLAGEISWEELARRTDGYIRPEQTTVTRKTRRVGEWDGTLARQAVLANGGPNGPTKAALMFVDYWFPELAGRTSLDGGVWSRITAIENQIGCPVMLAGTGPNSIADCR